MAQLYSVIVNGVVFKDDIALVSQRSWEETHEPGKWTIPGGKVEFLDEDFRILTRNLAKEIEEEVGVSVLDRSFLYVTSNCFKRSDGTLVLAIIFCCDYASGEAQPLEDTIDVKWASRNELEALDFPPNVKEYVLQSFDVRDRIRNSAG